MGALAQISPLYERVAAALSESDAVQRAIEAVPARKRQPALILAALHDLVLAGRAPALAAAYAAGDGDAAAAAAIDTLLQMTDSVVAIATRRQTRTIDTGRCAVLYPAIAEAARRVGANAVGLIDVGGSAGLNLIVDRVGITYSDGQSLGDPASPVQLSSTIKGDRPIPPRAMPEVVTRVGVGFEPVDARWLRACLPPDQPERIARLEAELALAATAPPLLLPGDAIEVLPDAVPRARGRAAGRHHDVGAVGLPARAPSALPPPSRRSRRRPGGGVGVRGGRRSRAGDTDAGRPPAFGHSTIGVAVFERSALRAEAVGRCWSQGRWLEWLADSRA